MLAQVFRKMGSKMLTCAHKRRECLRLSLFLERYHKDGDEFLNPIMQVTGDETWVSYLNVKTKSNQSSRCVHIYQKAEKFLPARKLMETVFWDRKGVLMVEFMQQGTTLTSEVYCETLKKTAQRHSQQKAWNADIRCSPPP
jgi:hypothetical protein